MFKYKSRDLFLIRKMTLKIHLINHRNDKKISKKRKNEEWKHTFHTSYQNKATEIKIKDLV